MKKFLFAAAALSLLLVIPAPDATAAPMGGLGFRTAGSPFSALPISPVQTSPTIGFRHWMNDQVGFDFGLGYNQFKIEPSPETWTGFAFDVGLPISIKKVNDRVNFIFRPGFQWSSLEDEDTSFPATVKWTTIAVSGELEVEWMVTDNLSVSASQGLAYHKLEDDGSPKTTVTSFGTTGSNFTQLGFHVYLW